MPIRPKSGANPVYVRVRLVTQGSQHIAQRSCAATHGTVRNRLEAARAAFPETIWMLKEVLETARNGS
ncbi:hypothetical protein LMG9964_05667 [Paraburkholderia phenoliruptrix]|uniref:Uncharacterized protein n=1 Tax=Paraburkholderia phenoliruptrix TaxID=252970 RepID=A0A6J5KCK7_9BURK|nr:hypothetical protein LMG9964_05667 [Paraburkholderia phenoliruptrix]